MQESHHLYESVWFSITHRRSLQCWCGCFESERYAARRAFGRRERAPLRRLEGIPQALRSHWNQRVLRLHRGKHGIRELRWKDRRCRTGQLSAQSKTVWLESRDSRCASAESSDPQCVCLWFTQKLFPYAIIQYDTERDEPLRDSSGLCVEVPKGQRSHT